ncbi:MAG: molybdenum cofactor guanylyltransferase, partial [Candidatus Ranarchaeia archaeon]
MILKKNITVAILAGGKSLRIDEKPFLKINEKTLLEIIINQVRDLTDNLLVIVKNDNQKTRIEQLKIHNIKIVTDLIKEISTPLIGIYTALNSTLTPYVLILPCDSPIIQIDFLKELISMIQNYGAIIPKWPNGWIEPLHAIYSKK